MQKITCFTVSAVFVLFLQGCTTTNDTVVGSAMADAISLPSGTTGCTSPNIVTEEGTCKEPDKLSWEKS